MTFIQSYISKQDKDRLKYCIICKNKVLDVKYNALCGLNMSLAKFDKNCNDFKFDYKEYDILRGELINDYKSKDDDLISIYSDIYYNEASDFKNDLDYFIDTINGNVFKSNFLNLNLILSFIALILFVLVLVSKGSHDPIFYIWTSAIFLGIVSSLMINYFKSVRKIVVLNDFIEFHNFKLTKYSWSEVLTIHSKTLRTKTRYGYSYKIGLIIDLIVGDSIEFQYVTFLNPKNNAQFLLCLDYYRKQYINGKLYK